MSEEYVIGVDKGTSVVKAVAFDAHGHEAACSRRPIHSLHPRPGWHEEDPEESWRLTCEAIGDTVGTLPEDAVVRAVGCTAHMGGAWLVDGEGDPVRNAICWPDGRAHGDQAEMEVDGRLDRFFEITGNAPMPGVTVMVLRHLLRNEPAVVDRAEHVLIGKDFIRLRLTGEIATEPSDVSWMPGDAATRNYSEELLELCEIGSLRKLFPPITQSGDIAGHVTESAAAATGLPEGTPVVAGLADGVANSVGTGTLEPGQAVTVLGTSCLNQLVVSDVALEPFGLGFLWTMPNDTRIRVLPNTAGTMSIDWMLRTAVGHLRKGSSFDFGEIERMVNETTPGAGGIVVIPYLNPGGVLAPFFDPQARGTVFGVSAQTSPAQLVRAAFEGLAFAVRDCYEAMSTPPGAIRVTGGGAGSELLCQLIADVTGRPVGALGLSESGAAGVGMLSAVAAGMGDDLGSLAATWCSPARTFEPDPDHVGRLEVAYGLYTAVRDAIRPLSALRHEVELGGER